MPLVEEIVMSEHDTLTLRLGDRDAWSIVLELVA